MASDIRSMSAVAAISKFSGFEISGLQPRHVVVADVAAVLAQMRGDAVGAGLDRNQGRAQRIGIAPRPRIAKRGDVVDIDSETQRRKLGMQELATLAVMPGRTCESSSSQDDPRIHLLRMDGLPGQARQ